MLRENLQALSFTRAGEVVEGTVTERPLNHLTCSHYLFVRTLMVPIALFSSRCA
jgi:hypothetical protein